MVRVVLESLSVLVTIYWCDWPPKQLQPYAPQNSEWRKYDRWMSSFWRSKVHISPIHISRCDWIVGVEGVVLPLHPGTPMWKYNMMIKMERKKVEYHGYYYPKGKKITWNLILWIVVIAHWLDFKCLHSSVVEASVYQSGDHAIESRWGSMEVNVVELL